MTPPDLEPGAITSPEPEATPSPEPEATTSANPSAPAEPPTNPPPTPPVSAPGTSPTGPSAGGPAPETQRAAVTLPMLALVGALVVLLSFAASFLGARLATGDDTAEAASTSSASPTPSDTPSVTPTPSPSVEKSPLTLPAGADVRAGNGTPSDTYGVQGDIYLNVANGDVYVRGATQWRRAGNLGAFASENLTGDQGQQGQQGEQGEQGKPGEPGASGSPGRPGTQVLLGKETPDPKACTDDGDIFINVVEHTFYKCTGGKWLAFS